MSVTVLEALKQLNLELDQVNNETHPVYLELLETLNATKTRLLGLADLQYEQEIAFAEKNAQVQRETIENDYKLGFMDINNVITGDLRKRRNELLEMLKKLGATKYVEELEKIEIQ